MKLRVTVQGNTYEVDVEVVDAGLASSSGAGVGSAPIAAPMRIPEAMTPAGGPAEKVCRAPIPGSIVQVKVKPGQVVPAHEVLVVLEAMKMETPLTLPMAGRIKTVLVEVGTAVRQGQALVELE